MATTRCGRRLGRRTIFATSLNCCQNLRSAFFTVDVMAIMDGIQQRAKKAGIHLGNFFLPPDHPLFVKWITEFRTAREKAQAQFDPIKKPMRGPSERERQAFEDVLRTI